MKKISVVIPCYNEEENIREITEAVIDKIKKYDYEIIICDNHSTDKTQKYITEICKNNKKVKAIFNIKNFGLYKSPYYGMLQATGDCVISVCADFQDPVELIPKFIEEWEKGSKIVVGIKNKSEENRFMYGIRTIYYKLANIMSDVQILEHFSGFALYDKDFIDILKNLDERTPFIKGLVAELGYDRKEIYYTQPKRKKGKSKNNFWALYDYAMLSFTSYTKAGLRFATFMGMVIAFFSFIIGLIYLILKLVYWNNFSAGAAPVVIGTFFLGSIQLFFIGLLGEYIMAINERVKHRPLVIEEKRINFD